MRIEQDPDRVPRRLIRWSLIAIAVAIAASVGTVLLLAGPGLGETIGEGAPIAAPPPQLDSEPFHTDTAPERERRAAAERLAHYGWVDRRAGLIHVPLDVAIELFLAERRR
jgi:hypothetical protein